MNQEEEPYSPMIFKSTRDKIERVSFLSCDKLKLSTIHTFSEIN